MCAWGAAFKSCDDLISRIERNDPLLTDLTILPTKSFGDAELNRLSAVLRNATEKLYWRSLSASGHAVSAAALERFGRAIASASASAYSQLHSLALGNSTTGDEGVKAFVDGLLSKTTVAPSACSLHSIDLSYKGMGIAGLQALAVLAEAHPTIKVLNLSRNDLKLTDNDSSCIVEPPVIFRHVLQLDFSACVLDALFAQTILPRLALNDERPTTTLVLSNNPLGDAGLEAVLRLSCCLDGLFVSNCQLTNAAMHHFAAAVNQLSECKILDFSHNALTATCAAVLGDSLKTKNNSSVLPKLSEINLSGNAIGTHGVQAVVTGLACLGHVKSLDLSETACGVDGAVAATRNAGEMGLHSLRLYNNKLGSTGFLAMAEALADSIANNSSLRALDVAGNGADQAAVVTLLQALLECLTRDSSSVTLNCLVIGGNQGGKDVENMVRQILAIRPDMDIARDKIKRQSSS
jgi:Leucine Rich repeat